MTSDPYFVWHDYESQEDQDEEMNEDQWSWLEKFEPEDVSSYSEVVAKTFNRLKHRFKDFMSKKYLVEIISSKVTEDIIKESLNKLKNNNKLIMYGAVEYKDAIAYFDAYDTKSKTLFYFKPSTSTKAIDMLRMFWTKSILEKNNIQVNSVKIVVLKIDEYKKNEVTFYISDKCNTTKTSRNRGKRADKFDYQSIQEIKTGNFISTRKVFGKEKEVEDEPYSISKLLDPTFLVDAQKEKRVFAIKDALDIDIEDVLQDIKDLEDEERPTSFINRMEFSPFENPAFAKEVIIEELGEVGNVSGQILQLKDYLNDEKVLDFKDSKFCTLIKENAILINSPELYKISVKNAYLTLINKNQGNVVWFDFEGFSLPFAPMDGVLPFNQIVFQCSIIRTNNHKYVSNDNLIYDPKSISLDDYYTMIDKIYSDGANSYVVYSKAYEHTRLKEIISLMEKDSYKHLDKASKMVNYIAANTIDLADLFTISKKSSIFERVNPENRGFPLVFIPELYGYYSIKKLEKHITKRIETEGIKLNTVIKPYSSLDVQNGQMAMDVAIQRYLDIIGDNEWRTYSDRLIEYCENDVRAMIMVKDYLIFLNNNKSEK